jgi:hypothetical protein
MSTARSAEKVSWSSRIASLVERSALATTFMQET